MGVPTQLTDTLFIPTSTHYTLLQGFNTTGAWANLWALRVNSNRDFYAQAFTYGGAYLCVDILKLLLATNFQANTATTAL